MCAIGRSIIHPIPGLAEPNVEESHSQTKFLLLALAVAAISLLVGALAWKVQQGKTEAYRSLIAYPQPRTVADFTLQDETGTAFSLDGFRGQWSVLFFGFTSCPDICPNTLFQLQQARAKWAGEAENSRVPGIYLVSVDPERDSPQRLMEYLEYFGPGISGLTGEPPQLQALARQLGIAFHVQDHESGDLEYSVDHSAALVLLNPEGQLFGVMTAPHDADDIAHDISLVIQQNG